MKKTRSLLLFCTALLLFCALLEGCQSPSDSGDDDAPGDVVTPVSTTTISTEAMADTITLNATSAYLIKSFIKSDANGYLQMKDLQPGVLVRKGTVLFSVRTKEATALGNSINVLDTSFHFSGVNKIPANINGFILQLDHQPGDYVQDGEQLAVLAASNSFVFLMDVPYELRPFILNKKKVELVLPDGERIYGMIDRTMPVMDSATQTQQMVIGVNPPHSIPENLIAQARIVRNQKTATPVLPKEAILTDETQTRFWVMKMMNDSVAIKVPVRTGMEANGRVEILSPGFSIQDRILLTGNFGLPDTARVSVTNK